MYKGIKLLFMVCVYAFLTGCTIQTGAESGSVKDNPQPNSQNDQGYRAAVYDVGDDSFLVAGTGGRLDKINSEKIVHNINVPVTDDLLDFGFDEKILLIAGTNGTILYSEDGIKFNKAETGILSTIYGVTTFKGKYIACAQEGVILVSDDGKTWKRKRFADGRDIIDISANDNFVMAITAESDVYISSDGVNWSFMNYNETYEGYYDPYIFKGIHAGSAAFVVYCQLEENPDAPVIIRTDDGKAWSHIALSQIDTGGEEEVVARMNALAVDYDQLMIVCDEGRLLTVSDCIECHKLSKIADVDLHTVAQGKDNLLVAGDDFVFDLIEPTLARQFNIKPEQAYENLKSGAVIIDVRTGSEYNEGHIKGSINIPVEQLSEKLPELVSDKNTTIMFYCSKGTRSQTALEAALELGYGYVYNLGSFSDWPYETE